MKRPVPIYLALAALLTVATFLMLFLESVPYLRFIVSSLGVNTSTMQIVTLLSWVPLFFIRGLSAVRVLIIILLVTIVSESTAKTTLHYFREMRNLAADPFASYDRKMATVYGVYRGFYPAMKEVRRITPPDSTIIIPPQRNPWEIEGNPAMVSYFLYPRRVVNMELNSLTIPPSDKQRYLLIAKGSWDRTGQVEYDWPKIAVRAANIWEIHADTGNSTLTQQNYDPEVHKWNWGLIEVSDD